MKKIDKCLCGGKLEDVAVVRDGIHLLGQKCVKCNEIYFDAEEMLRYEMLREADYSSENSPPYFLASSFK